MSQQYQNKIEEYEDVFGQSPDLWLREESEGIRLMQEAIDSGEPMRQRKAQEDIFT